MVDRWKIGWNIVCSILGVMFVGKGSGEKVMMLVVDVRLDILLNDLLNIELNEFFVMYVVVWVCGVWFLL